MTIKAENIGKKFAKHWIFRHHSFVIEGNEHLAITGNNGAGKSTMLQIIAGYLTPSQGHISYEKYEEAYEVPSTFIGPYSEIIEEFTLKEFLTFHSQFRNPTSSFKVMADAASLPLHKHIHQFSTGMKQRAKLLTAFYFENEVIYMDEPTANLDEEGCRWWAREIDNLKNSTLLLASNLEREVSKCHHRLAL